MSADDEMFLRDVQNAAGGGSHAEVVRHLRAAGQPVPGILHLFAYKPDRTDHLARFTQAVMRGPSPLSAGERELIAAFTSEGNRCRF